MKETEVFSSGELINNDNKTGSYCCDELSFDRDREYWNRFYLENEGLLNLPSNFARFVRPYLTKGKHLLELGCGNGRDCLFFLNSGLIVTGIDASDYVILKLKQKLDDNRNAIFICDDFVKYYPASQIKYNYVYSRFTLHAISEQQENSLLNNIKEFLSDEGLFFVEARTVRDELFGKGIRVNKNAYIYNDHYRRFIDSKEFKEKLEKLKFEILLFDERTGFSKTKDSDPVLLRCIARIKAGN